MALDVLDTSYSAIKAVERAAALFFEKVFGSGGMGWALFCYMTMKVRFGCCCPD